MQPGSLVDGYGHGGSVAVGDFNNDGRPDLAILNWNGNDWKLKVALNDGNW